MPIIVHYFVLSKEFCMTFFAPRAAMTTAEPPEPLAFQHPVSIMDKHNHQVIGGPAARHLYYYRLFSCFSEKIFSKA